MDWQQTQDLASTTVPAEVPETSTIPEVIPTAADDPTTPQPDPSPGPSAPPEPEPPRVPDDPMPEPAPPEIPATPGGPVVIPPGAPQTPIVGATDAVYQAIEDTVEVPSAIEDAAPATDAIAAIAEVETPAAPPVPTGPDGEYIFLSTSNRPIDRFIALVLNDVGKMAGTTINTSRRGQALEIDSVIETGVQRKNAKGTTTEIPRAALEWAIKQLYLNGELSRSKMTESYKENGSSLASGVFAILTQVRFFEATDNPLTLHFYKLQFEDELYG